MVFNVAPAIYISPFDLHITVNNALKYSVTKKLRSKGYVGLEEL